MTTILRSFVGERLRDARLARQMTATALAERVGVTSGSISHYEKRSVDPRPQVIARIATELSLPETYFFREVLGPDPAPYLYRSFAAPTKKARESAEVRLRWLREILHFAIGAVDVPAVDIADLGFPAHPASLRPEDVESAASDIRAKWKLGEGPIPNVLTLLESKGCCITRFAFGANSLDAFSQYAQERPYVALNSEKGTAVRFRFDAAHELGHLVLHRTVPANVAAQPEQHKLMERQAHRFAAAFLFPQGSFRDEVYSTSINTLITLKKRWKVSIQLMTRRARDLGLVSQDQYERSCREISRLGYRQSEPLDDELPVEKPTVLMKAIQLIVDHGEMTRFDLLSQLALSPVDVEILAQLPRGYLEHEDWGSVVELRPSPQPHEVRVSANETSAVSGNVLPFRRRP